MEEGEGRVALVATVAEEQVQVVLVKIILEVLVMYQQQIQLKVMLVEEILQMMQLELPAEAGEGRRVGRGILEVARKVAATDGVRGFYRGIVPELAKVVPGVGIAFSTYEFAKARMGVE